MVVNDSLFASIAEWFEPNPSTRVINECRNQDRWCCESGHAQFCVTKWRSDCKTLDSINRIERKTSDIIRAKLSAANPSIGKPFEFLVFVQLHTLFVCEFCLCYRIKPTSVILHIAHRHPRAMRALCSFFNSTRRLQVWSFHRFDWQWKMGARKKRARRTTLICARNHCIGE